jgi:signal transduction histidine kinase
MIAREAIANAFLHAGATEITFRLKFSWSHFDFICEDNGHGIPTGLLEDAKNRNSLGILGMQERAHKIGAALHFERSAPRGTKIELKLNAGIAYTRNMQSALEHSVKGVLRRFMNQKGD